MANAAPPRSKDPRRSNYGLVGYFLGAYLVTGIFWIPAVLADAGRLTLPVPSIAFLAIGGLGPMLVAIIVTVIQSGTGGVQLLFGQLKQWRAFSIWYVMALIGIPIIGLAAAGIHAALGGALATESIPEIVGVLPFQFVFVALVGGGLNEEMGRRGFVLPRLQRRYTTPNYDSQKLTRIPTRRRPSC